MTKLSSLNQGHNSLEVVNGSVKIPVTKSRKKWGRFLMQILGVYLVIISCVYLIEPPSSAAGDNKPPVSGSCFNYFTYGLYIGYAGWPPPAFNCQDLTVYGSNEIGPGVSPQLKPVGKDPGEKPSDKPDYTKDSVGIKSWNFRHDILESLLWLLFGFFAGYGPPDIFYGRTKRKPTASKPTPFRHF